MNYFVIFLGIVIIFSSQNVFAQEVPSWIKNSAGWWAEDSIGDADFLKGIEYLISNGLISIEMNQIESDKQLMIGGFDLSRAGPFEGESNSSFTIIMFSDHQCEKMCKMVNT